MLRILFIEKDKNTKSKNFKALNIIGHSTNGGDVPILKLFQINNQLI